MEAFYKANHIRIYNKDCLFMEELGDESVDLIVTDPPYGIGFMGKDWDKFEQKKPTQSQTIGWMSPPMKKDTRGMMEFFTPIWRECLRVLKPGAFAFVMCIPRADCLSRVIISLEDAGFRVDFTPIYWTYASGFPKAQNIGKAVDKRLGNKREVVGKGKAGAGMNKVKGFGVNTTKGGEATTEWDETKGSSPLEGSYGGFQPKPAVEVIIVAMKPLSEKTFVDQALKNRKGITWLDDCRIPIEKGDRHKYGVDGDEQSHTGETGVYGNFDRVAYEQSNKGRFPANLLVSDDVLNDGVSGKSRRHASYQFKKPPYDGGWKPLEDAGYLNDSASFSRYFDLDKWWEEKIEGLPESVRKTFPFLIVPKASKSEKNKGLETMPEVVKSGLPLRDGSGDYVLNEYGDSSMSTRNTKTKNYHPTVKPVKLMSYLITLGSREGDTVVDPFIGTGSMAIACQILGRKCTGYEINANYCEIGKGRLTYYCQKAMNL